MLLSLAAGAVGRGRFSSVAPLFSRACETSGATMDQAQYMIFCRSDHVTVAPDDDWAHNEKSGSSNPVPALPKSPREPASCASFRLDVSARVSIPRLVVERSVAAWRSVAPGRVDISLMCP